MKTLRGEKINQLMQTWPSGTVKSSRELAALGISPSLVQSYIKQGWLVSLGRGVYAKSHDKPNWLGGLHCLQQHKTSGCILAGGRTSLELQGYTHYVPTHDREIFLFAPSPKKLPAWFANYEWGQPIIFTSTALFPEDLEQSLVIYDAGTFTLHISSPERAALELLYHVPQKVRFQEAGHIVSNLATLRPVILQTLLEQCNSIKAKRLFLYLAKASGFHWFNHLNLATINLGSGKRVIVKNGILDKEFGITVPGDLDGELF
ncbi:type IV toxin-antitoxin system AbiEi family antitoxin domain-containing protein [Desulfoplanes sp.]